MERSSKGEVSREISRGRGKVRERGLMEREIK